MNPIRVLIADDEYWVRENLRELLRSVRPEVEILEPATDGEDALARTEVSQPDLLITDIDMPFLTGNQVIKAVRSRYPHLDVVVLSGYSDFSSVREALIDGARDYLLKPVTVADLSRVIDQVDLARRDRASATLEGERKAERWNLAEGLLRDEAISALLNDGPDGPPFSSDPEPLHLSGYTLLLVHVLDRGVRAGAAPTDVRDRGVKIKGLLTRELAGSGGSRSVPESSGPE